jgi:drug/metabolite transporter (DMT)-like permease
MWMGTLCVTGALGHWLLIKAYEMAEASTVQPFAFFQLVFVSILGLSVFGEVLRPNVAIGVAIILAAGIFTVLRARRVNAT